MCLPLEHSTVVRRNTACLYHAGLPVALPLHRWTVHAWKGMVRVENSLWLRWLRVG